GIAHSPGAAAPKPRPAATGPAVMPCRPPDWGGRHPSDIVVIVWAEGKFRGLEGGLGTQSGRGRNDQTAKRIEHVGSRIPRLVRGAIAATLSLFAAALGHVVAGGGFPGFIGVVLALFLALPACVWLAGRRVSWWRLGLGVTFT